MARIRTIKPEFFRHYELYLAEKEEGLPLRVAFAGLWTVADREGRFRWKPEELKLDCLPYDDLDFSRVLDALATRGFVEMYTANGAMYGWIPGFKKHQVINAREKGSDLPDPLDSNTSTRDARVPCTHVHAHGEKEREREQGTRNDASLTRQREAPSAPSPARGRRRSHSVPSSFAISDQLMRWAIATRPDLDIELEIQKFRDHEFKTPRSNWEATFRNWIRNARSPSLGKNNGRSYAPDRVGEPPPEAYSSRPDAKYLEAVSKRAAALFGGLEGERIDSKSF